MRAVKSLQALAVVLFTPLATSLVAIATKSNLFVELAALVVSMAVTLGLILDGEWKGEGRPFMAFGTVMSWFLVLLGLGADWLGWVISGETVITVGTLYALLSIELSLRTLMGRNEPRLTM